MGGAVLLQLVVFSAAPTDFELSWVAPAECTARPDVGALVGDARGAATVVISPEGSRWTVTVTFTAPVAGQRTLTAETCPDAANAAKLLLRLGTRAAVAPEEPAPPPPPPPPAVLTAPPNVPVVVSESFFFIGSLMAELQVFSAPASPRFGVSAWLGGDLLSAALTLTTGIPSQVAGGPTDSGAIELYSIFDGTLSGCLGHRWSTLRLAGCAEVEAAAWRLRGVEVASARTGFAALVALGAAARAWLALGNRFGLLATFAIRPLVMKPQANLEGFGTAWEAGPVEGAFSLGFGAAW